MKKAIVAVLAAWMLVAHAGAAELDGGRYYYSQLSTEGREIYDLLVENKESLRRNDEVTIEKTMDREGAERYMDEINTAVYAFNKDHPEVFWLRDAWNTRREGLGSRYVFSVRYSGLSGSWERGGRSIPDDEAFLNRQVTALAKEARDRSDRPYDQLLYIHDWLTSHNLYNSGAFEVGQAQSGDSAPWEAISALDEDLSPVCEGYAKAFQLVCGQMGIPCVIVTGGDHAWNYVLMDDGNWYAVDVTYDDPVYTVDGVEQRALISGGEQHDYFLVGSLTFFDDHTEDSQWEYPKLSETDYDPDAVVRPAQSAAPTPVPTPVPAPVPAPIEETAPVVNEDGNADAPKEPGASLLVLLIPAIVLIGAIALAIVLIVSRHRAAARRRRDAEINAADLWNDDFL